MTRRGKALILFAIATSIMFGIGVNASWAGDSAAGKMIFDTARRRRPSGYVTNSYVRLGTLWQSFGTCCRFARAVRLAIAE